MSKYPAEVYAVLEHIHHGGTTPAVSDYPSILAKCEKEGLVEWHPWMDGVEVRLSPLGRYALQHREEKEQSAAKYSAGLSSANPPVT